MPQQWTGRSDCGDGGSSTEAISDPSFTFQKGKPTRCTSILFYSILMFQSTAALIGWGVDVGSDTSTRQLLASQRRDERRFRAANPGTHSFFFTFFSFFFLLWWRNSRTRNDCGGHTKSHLETGQPWNCFTFSPPSEFFIFSFYIHIYWWDGFCCFSGMYFQ